MNQMSRIVPYDPHYRTALLTLSVRAWEHVFPLLRREVPEFVYNAFYPTGWRERQLNDLAEVLDNGSECIDVAIEIGRASCRERVERAGGGGAMQKSDRGNQCARR